jgi:hypothetical protein
MRVRSVRQARPFRGVGTTIAAGLLALGVWGCGGTQDANDPSRPLAAYSGRQADLFDDAIAPAAVGLDFDKAYSPKLDKVLRERAQVGDAVLRVRVSTVTAKSNGPEAQFHLGLHTVEKLAGKHPPPVDFTVQIDKTSESHGIMKNFESRLVGYAFVAFVREFAHPNGERELHFHLAPDTKEVKAAVGDAMLMGELR